jgi:hypothetical protein
MSVGGVPFTTDATTVTRRVYMPRHGADVRARMKLENGNKVLQTIEADAFTTDAEDWQALTFDFASAASNGPNDDPTEHLKVACSSEKVSLFFNFGMSTAQGGGTFSFDDRSFVKSPDPSGVIADDGFGITANIANAESVLGSAFCDRTPAARAPTRCKVRPAATPLDGGAPSTPPASAARPMPAPTSTRSPTSTRPTTSCSSRTASSRSSPAPACCQCRTLAPAAPAVPPNATTSCFTKATPASCSTTPTAMAPARRC